MTFEQVVLLLMPFGGLCFVVAFVFWQNHRDLAPIRKASQTKKK